MADVDFADVVENHLERLVMLGMDRDVEVAGDQGLTLVRFSAQLEPRLTQENTLHTLNTPKHPLNTGYTTPPRTPYPIQSAQVELKREGV